MNANFIGICKGMRIVNGTIHMKTNTNQCAENEHFEVRIAQAHFLYTDGFECIYIYIYEIGESNRVKIKIHEKKKLRQQQDTDMKREKSVGWMVAEKRRET